MINDEILNSLLEKSAKKALDKIRDEGTLTADEAIPLFLKSQFNHIAHLDHSITTIQIMMQNMATKDDIKNMATKDDILATKDEIKSTKDDIRRLDDSIENVRKMVHSNFLWTISAIIGVAGIITSIIKFA
jgi:SPX domain protein involved in polyphosphate accumulation